MIWFTSDTHFGHANVLRFCERPWETVEQMDAAIIGNINTWVAPNDDLYVLGDFSFKLTALDAAALRRRIRCRRVHLVPGNHDKDWVTNPAVAGTFMVERDVAKLKVDGRKVVMCHYPLMDWPSMSHGSILLHGHIHSWGSDYNDANLVQGIYRMDVGVDANGYRPVSLDDVLARFDGIESAGRLSWDQWVWLRERGDREGGRQALSQRAALCSEQFFGADGLRYRPIVIAGCSAY